MVSTNRASGASPAGRSLVSHSFLLVVVGRMVTEPLETLRYSLRLPITFPSQTSPLARFKHYSVSRYLTLFVQPHYKQTPHGVAVRPKAYLQNIDTSGDLLRARVSVMVYRAAQNTKTTSLCSPPSPQIHNTIIAENKRLCGWLQR